VVNLGPPHTCDSIPYLNSCSIGDGLVRVDALVQLLPVEEVLQQLLDLWNPASMRNGIRKISAFSLKKKRTQLSIISVYVYVNLVLILTGLFRESLQSICSLI
jgi:hypothetical protein